MISLSEFEEMVGIPANAVRRWAASDRLNESNGRVETPGGEEPKIDLEKFVAAFGKRVQRGG